MNLKTALVNMGLGDIFNPATADFTRITCKSTFLLNVHLSGVTVVPEVQQVIYQSESWRFDP